MAKKGTITSVVPKPTAKNYVKNNSRKIKTPIVAETPDFIPKYKTKGAACADLLANIAPDLNGQRLIRLMPGHTELIDCGISIALPADHEAQIRARSGLASKGIIVTNATEEQEGGTIDFDYRLKIKVILTNVSRNIFVINHMDRIAQMAIKPVWYFDFEPTSQLPEVDSDRVGGIGSTGIK